MLEMLTLVAGNCNLLFLKITKGKYCSMHCSVIVIISYVCTVQGSIKQKCHFIRRYFFLYFHYGSVFIVSWTSSRKPPFFSPHLQWPLTRTFLVSGQLQLWAHFSRSECVRLRELRLYIKHDRLVLQAKQLEFRQKYSATPHGFNSLLGVSKCGETRSSVFNMLHQSFLCFLQFNSTFVT